MRLLRGECGRREGRMPIRGVVAPSLRVFLLLTGGLAAISCAAPGAGSAPSGDSAPLSQSAPWSGETGIYGTDQHFGNPPTGVTFICGVAFDLRYSGAEPIQTLNMSVRYPDAFLGRLDATVRQSLAGWHPIPASPSGAGSWQEAASNRHAVATTGTVCPGGASDVESIKGTQIKLEWTSPAGPETQTIAISEFRGGVIIDASGVEGAHLVWKTGL